MRRLSIRLALGTAALALLLGGANGRVVAAAADTTTVPWHGIISATQSDVSADSSQIHTQSYSVRALVTTSGAGSISWGYNDEIQFLNPGACSVPANDVTEITTGSGSFDHPVTIDVNPDNAVTPTEWVSIDAADITGTQSSGTVTETSTDTCGRVTNTDGSVSLGFSLLVPVTPHQASSENRLSGRVMWQGIGDPQLENLGMFGLTLSMPNSNIDIKYELSDLADTDGDGLLDDVEMTQTHTDPFNPDTDGDGLSDGAEVHSTHTDPNNADTDGDGWGDGTEVGAGTDPLDPNSHPTGTPPGGGGSPTPPVFTTTPSDPTTVRVAPPATTTPVRFDIAAIDSNGAVPVSCDHTSGSVFGVGSTTVTCTASNSAGSTSYAFHVVVQVDQAPLAQDDSFSAMAGVMAPLDVLHNDSDPDHDPIVITNLTSPTCGVAFISGFPGVDEKVLYFPPSGGCAGGASFTYTAGDGFLTSNVAHVSISVAVTNRPPIAKDVTITLGKDGLYGSGNVLASDRDPDDNHLHLVGVHAPIITNPGATVKPRTGQLQCAPNGWCRYLASVDPLTGAALPPPQWFQYAVSDGHGGLSYAHVNIVVGSKNVSRPSAAGFGSGPYVFGCVRTGIVSSCSMTLSRTTSYTYAATVPTVAPEIEDLAGGVCGGVDVIEKGLGVSLDAAAPFVPGLDLLSLGCTAASALAAGLESVVWGAIVNHVINIAAADDCIAFDADGTSSYDWAFPHDQSHDVDSCIP